MQSAAVFVALLACASATHLVYNTVPLTYNSAVVKSDRLGGNFAYSVQSNPAYVHPAVVRTVPAAVSYTYNNQVVKTPIAYTHTPVVATHTVPVNTVYAAGTPAHTYKTVAGVSPIYYNNLAHHSNVYGGYPVVY